MYFFFFILSCDSLSSNMRRITTVGITELLRKFLELTRILVFSTFSEKYCQKNIFQVLFLFVVGEKT